MSLTIQTHIDKAKDVSWRSDESATVTSRAYMKETYRRRVATRRIAFGQCDAVIKRDSDSLVACGKCARIVRQINCAIARNLGVSVNRAGALLRVVNRNTRSVG